LKIQLQYSRSLVRAFGLAALIATGTLSLRIAAQEPAPVPVASQTGATAPATGQAAPEAAKAENAKPSQKEQEEAFLHAPIVQSLARMLHLNVQTTINLFLLINFAIIFFAIVIPIGRLMPKVIRKRSQTVRHGLDEAREATADAQARLSAVEAKIAGLGDEIQSFRAQVEKDGVDDEKRIKASITEESAHIVTTAEQEIDVAITQAKRGLRDFAAELAIEQATRQMALTAETDRALISEFISGMAADSGKGGKN
jgi:F-type H+-transporting ATPase subunit b